jgi:lambda repressor-like predicted transcriptional regulator
MDKPFLLPLNTALSKLSITKTELSNHAALSSEQIDTMLKRGVTLQEAEIISQAYAHHPSEIWGENWVDAVLTMVEWQERGDDDCCQ